MTTEQTLDTNKKTLNACLRKLKLAAFKFMTLRSSFRWNIEIWMFTESMYINPRDALTQST